jgi:hypothetical protein
VTAHKEAAEDLALAIVAAFGKDSRGFQGNRSLCESEDVLRTWLIQDHVQFDSKTLAAAIQILETGSVPGIRQRLVRGSELHKRYAPANSSSYPGRERASLPHRAMLLDQPLVMADFRKSDLQPYLV